MAGGRWVDSLGAWLLVVLGGLLLLTGTLSLFGALVDRAWGEAAVSPRSCCSSPSARCAAARQLRRGRRRGAAPRTTASRGGRPASRAGCRGPGGPRR